MKKPIGVIFSLLNSLVREDKSEVRNQGEFRRGEKVRILKSRKVAPGTIGYVVDGPTQFSTAAGWGSSTYSYRVQAEGKLVWVVEHNIERA